MSKNRAYLLFRLYGPLASFGDTAVGEYRPTYDRPSKSAVLGLVAAALGIRRDEIGVHESLERQLGFGVRVESAGMLMRDFHTSQVPPARLHRIYPTRRTELLSSDLTTILSTRDYRCDALYHVALWHVPGQTKKLVASLEDIQQALRQPKFTLYLGRKSCPLAFPLAPQLVEARNLRSAFHNAGTKNTADSAQEQLLQQLKRGLRIRNSERARIYWEGDDSGFQAHTAAQRRDRVTNRQRQQFGNRTEYQGLDDTAGDAD